jgi:hypothetical protein
MIANMDEQHNSISASDVCHSNRESDGNIVLQNTGLLRNSHVRNQLTDNGKGSRKDSSISDRSQYQVITRASTLGLFKSPDITSTCNDDGVAFSTDTLHARVLRYSTYGNFKMKDTQAQADLSLKGVLSNCQTSEQSCVSTDVADKH